MLQDITALEERRQREWTSNQARTWDLHYNVEFQPHELQNWSHSFVFHCPKCANHECAAYCNCLRSVPQCCHLCRVMVVGSVGDQQVVRAHEPEVNGVIASVYVKYVFVSFYASGHHSSGGKVTCEKRSATELKVRTYRVHQCMAMGDEKLRLLLTWLKFLLHYYTCSNYTAIQYSVKHHKGWLLTACTHSFSRNMNICSQLPHQHQMTTVLVRVTHAPSAR